MKITEVVGMIEDDFSKLKELGLSEKDFDFEATRACTAGSVGVISEQNSRVTVTLKELGISVGYEGYKSQLKNKEVALNLMYSLLKEVFGDPSIVEMKK